VSGAFVKIGFFRSESELVYHDEVHGDLFKQVATTIDLLQTKYFRAAIRYEGIQRIERYPVPRAALREAILNALIHRDYSVPAPVQIRVYADRLKLWNPAVLPEGWSLDHLLKEHPSLPFNPHIANAFFRAGEIEAWGRGIERIFQACRDAGTPEPQVRLTGHDLLIDFLYASKYVRAIEVATKTPGITPGITPGKVPGKTPARIFELLAEDPHLTAPAIAARLSKSESAVHRAIRRLQATGQLRRVGSRKAGHWEVLP
jgi:ATP-dependent DNA helicase RecG